MIRKKFSLSKIFSGKYRWLIWFVVIGVAFNIGTLFTISSTNSKNLIEHNFPQSQIIFNGELYAFSYDTRTKNPSWVMEILTKEDSTTQIDPLQNKHIDGSILKSSFPKMEDYLYSNFEPAPLLISSKLKYLFLDSSPQNSNFISSWVMFNDYIRNIPKKLDVNRILVITEPLYLPQETSKKVIYDVIGNNNVAVPTHFFRAIFYPSKSQESLFEKTAGAMPVGPDLGISISKMKIHGELYLIPNQVINDKISFDVFRLSNWEDVKKINGIILPNDIRFYLENM